MSKVLILIFAALTLSACIFVPVGHDHDGDRDSQEHHDDRRDHDHHD